MHWDGDANDPQFIRLAGKVRELVGQHDALQAKQEAAEAAERERLGKEKAAAEQQAREEAEQQRRLAEEARIRRETAEAAERERLAKEKKLAEERAAEQKAREEAERQAKARQEQLKREQAAAEEKARKDAARQAKANQEPPDKQFPWIPVLLISAAVLGSGGYYWRSSVGASPAGDSSMQKSNSVKKESLAGQAPTAIPQTVASSHYIIHNDGTVTDTKTGLMWKQCSEGQSGKNCTVWPLIGEVVLYKTETAKDGDFSKPNDINTNFAGFSDWRMPTHEELRTLVYCSNGTPQEKAWRDSCGKRGEYQQPTIDLNVFPNTRDWLYLSSSMEDKRYAWGVDFSTGEDDWDHADYPAHVRLVRSVSDSGF